MIELILITLATLAAIAIFVAVGIVIGFLIGRKR
jgi:ElaB/YqjD/DUF883 family membrane-anchored ribosome-binding protein